MPPKLTPRPSMVEDFIPSVSTDDFSLELAVDPYALAYANGYDALLGRAFVYVMRHKGKDKATDLLRAASVIRYRLNLIQTWGLPAKSKPKMNLRTVVRLNNMSDLEEIILLNMDMWGQQLLATADLETAQLLIRQIHHLKKTEYGETE